MPGGLPGVPLEYTMNSAEMTMNFTVTDISFEPVDASKFKMEIPAGYKEMDLKALKKMGGMGF
jgi:outer membrane lipoprotein-sorting protein